MHNRLRILFVCTMNKWRSPTAERLYRDDPRLEVRSAGISVKARRRVGASDLKWADLVFVMEDEHKSWLRRQFKGMKLPRIEFWIFPMDINTWTRCSGASCGN